MKRSIVAPALRWSSAAACLCLAFGGGPAPAAAQPTGSEASAVLARYVEAIGGLDALRAIETLRKTGTYVYNGLEHPVTVVQKRGAGCREEIDGLTTWGTSTEMGRRVIRAWDGAHAGGGDQAEELRTDAMPEVEAVGFVLDATLETGLVDAEAKGHGVELVGPAEIDGVAAVHLRLTRPDGPTEEWYLDAATHLPIHRAVAAPEGEYKAALTWYFDDYREVAGVRMPFYVLIEERLFSREYLFDEIVANVPVEAEAFVQPAGKQVEADADGSSG